MHANRGGGVAQGGSQVAEGVPPPTAELFKLRNSDEHLESRNVTAGEPIEVGG